MKPFKARYTEFVLEAAGKFPFFFSRRLRSQGAYHRELEATDANRSGFMYDCADTGGLFSGDMTWKGVSLVSAIDRKDLTKIHRWMKRQGGGMYHRNHEELIKSSDLLDSRWSNLGIVSFEKSNAMAVASIGLISSLPQLCYVSVLRLSKGVTYLLLYVQLNDSAGERVFNVDLSLLGPYKFFQSLNPFSPLFPIIENYTKRGASENLILRNAAEVVSDSRSAAEAVLQVCGVKKDIKDFAVAADFCREDTEPYFNGSPRRIAEEQESNYFVCERASTANILSTICDDPKEEFLEMYICKKIDVNAIFIKTAQHESERLGEQSFCNALISAGESFTYFLMISEVRIQLKKCMNMVEPIFFSYKKNPKKDLRILISASLKLNLIDERIGALQEGVWRAEEKYIESIKARINKLKVDVDGLRKDIDRRRELNNSDVQLSSLTWTKSYSYVVGVLVIVQIALSMLGVDWSVEGIERNPFYINLFKWWLS